MTLIISLIAGFVLVGAFTFKAIKVNQLAFRNFEKSKVTSDLKKTKIFKLQERRSSVTAFISLMILMGILWAFVTIIETI